MPILYFDLRYLVVKGRLCYNMLKHLYKGVEKLFIRKIHDKFYRTWFCKQYVKRSKELLQYTFLLKYLRKKSSIKTRFINVSVYDVLDNDGMNCLIKKLYRLKKDDTYKVSTRYRKPAFKTMDYIGRNLAGMETGLIGEVKFKENKWLSGITIGYTYANSSEIILEYCFEFKKVMGTYIQIHDFVVDNILTIKKPPFFHSYADKNVIKRADYREIFKLDEIFFADILQAYICQLFYTQIGLICKLPVEYDKLVNKLSKRDKQKLKELFPCECYEQDEKFLIVNKLNYNRFEITHLQQGKDFPRSVLLTFFSFFSTEMLYNTFYSFELNLIECRMRKYLNSRRSFVSSGDIKWFINKQRKIAEQEEKIKERLKPENRKELKRNGLVGWNLYCNGKKEEKFDFINYPVYTQYFKNLYQQNLEYLNSIASVQNNKVITIITVATFIATIISILISLIK